MTGLDKVTRRILDDAKDRAREILDGAEADRCAIREDHQKRAESFVAELAAATEAECENLVARSRSAAAMERRNVLLTARAALIDEVFEGARQAILAAETKKYRALLVSLLSGALTEQIENERVSLSLGDEVKEVDRFEVLLNETDRARLGDAVVGDARRAVESAIGAERAAKIVLSRDVAKIDGGLILRYGDVEVNCSLAVLLAEARQKLEAKLTDLLFQMD